MFSWRRTARMGGLQRPMRTMSRSSRRRRIRRFWCLASRRSGQPIRACVHRPAIFAARCGVSEDDLLTPELAATFIDDETPHTRVLLNQADTAERLALGRGMAAMLRGPVCLGTFRRSG